MYIQNEKQFEYRLPADQQFLGMKRIKNNVQDDRHQFEDQISKRNDKEYKVRIIDRLG